MGALSLTLLLALAAGAPILPGAIPAGAWPFIVGIGIFSTSMAILGFAEGTRRIGAARAALISTVEFGLGLGRLSPNMLFSEAALAFLNPGERGQNLGVLLPQQLQGAIHH